MLVSVPTVPSYVNMAKDAAQGNRGPNGVTEIRVKKADFRPVSIRVVETATDGAMLTLEFSVGGNDPRLSVPSPTPAYPLVVSAIAPACPSSSVFTGLSWWGVRLHLSDCQITNLATIFTWAFVGSTLAAVICGAYFGLGCAFALLVLSLQIALAGSWLNSANDRCAKRGAYFNVSWLGIWWVTQVC
jgi:hypothetical protein